MDANDEKILVNTFLKTRSEDAFRQLYRLHTESLFRLAARILGGDKEAAAEVVQDTWVRAIESLHKFKWHSAFKTWLSAIVINCCREYGRKNPAMQTGQHEMTGGFSTQNEHKLDINRALSLMPQGYRDVLILHDIEGYKHEEIGMMLGINEGTSKSQLFHARKAIQKLIK